MFFFLVAHLLTSIPYNQALSGSDMLILYPEWYGGPP